MSGAGTGGTGTYQVSIPDQAVAAGTAITGSYGILTLGAVPSTPLAPGSVLSGSGVTPGTVIFGTPTIQGPGGTAVVSPSQTVASTTLTATLNVETKWSAMSTGPAGSLVKITSWNLG
jgi:hypothetical protein